MYVKVDLRDYLTPLVGNVLDSDVKLLKEERDPLLKDLVDAFVKVAENIIPASNFEFDKGLKGIFANKNTAKDLDLVKGAGNWN